MIETRRAVAALVLAVLLLPGVPAVLAQSATPIGELKEGTVTVSGKVGAGAPITAPLSGLQAVLVRTEARLGQDGGASHVGPKKGAKELAVDFAVTDASGTVTVFVQAAKSGKVRWKADVWDQELVRGGRKMTQEGQRAIRSLMGEPEAMGLFSSAGDVIVREAWVAPGQVVTVRGTYRKSPSPGIYPTDEQPLTIDAAGGAAGASSGGMPTWALVGGGVAVAVVVLFLLRGR